MDVRMYVYPDRSALSKFLYAKGLDIGKQSTKKFQLIHVMAFL